MPSIDRNTLIFYLLSQIHTSSPISDMVFATVVIGIIIFGLAPLPVSSLWARLMRIPFAIQSKVTGRRPFNFTPLDTNLFLGRAPRHEGDLSILQNVRAPTTLLLCSPLSFTP
jgi:hypothetical protein